MTKKFILRFIGKKAELHQQLKVWCAQTDKTMNGRIIELIEENLKKTKKFGTRDFEGSLDKK